MSYDTLEIAKEGPIAIVRLNRPKRMNAFTDVMTSDLEDFFTRVNDADDVRAVVVTGAGDVFCAGMDLNEHAATFALDHSIDIAGEGGERNRDTGGVVALAIFNCRKPVIAAVNGAAVGVGATMTLPMDFRLASTKARFGFVFSKIGIMPEACSNWFLPRLVGMPQALEWAYTGEIFSAEAARAGGLVSDVLAPEDLLPAAVEKARRLTENGAPTSIAAIRHAMWRMAGAAHPMEAHILESRAIFEMSQADGKEGVTAFLEKRSPTFRKQVSDGMPQGFPWRDEPTFTDDLT